MQILHPFAGSIQQYVEQLADADRFRPSCCPMCEAKRLLTAHGFYSRTLVDRGFDGIIRVRRYVCRVCCRTVSLLPEFTLPYLRFGITVLGLFLTARLLDGSTLRQAAEAAGLVFMPHQRGQQWIGRFQSQAARLAAALAALAKPAAASDFTERALRMLDAIGWIRSHRFLLSRLRVHLLGWPRFLAPDGRYRLVRPA